MFDTDITDIDIMDIQVFECMDDTKTNQTKNRMLDSSM